METAHLLHLASIASPSLPIKAAAVHCIFAGRAKEGGSGDFIDPQRVAKLEPRVGKACLDALIGWEIDEKVSNTSLLCFRATLSLLEADVASTCDLTELASGEGKRLGIPGET